MILMTLTGSKEFVHCLLQRYTNTALFLASKCENVPPMETFQEFIRISRRIYKNVL